MPDPILSVSNVIKTYDTVTAVDRLSFIVFPATCFGLLGPNGAGKTTMMKIIYGKCFRDRNDDDRLSVFGFDPKTNELDIKYLSGVVPQEDNLDQELNVFQNLFVYSKFYNMPSREAKERIEYLLDFMELSNKRMARLRELSGGMKRRLVIARALIHAPRLLILDEPTVGLDPQVRHVIWDKIRQLKKEGVTVLLTTHYMEEAFQICDRIIIMDKGRMILEGKPHDLMEAQIEKYVLEILGDADTFCEKPFDPAVIRKDDQRGSACYFSNNFHALKDIADTFENHQYFLRQSNLEDLFLRATGRTLNEQQ